MTTRPYGALTTERYQRHIRAAADEVLAWLDRGRVDAPTPACPGWTVGDVVEHVGQVHQWARLNITDLDTAPVHSTTPPGTGDDLAEWYEECVTDLLAVLRATDPSAPCWTFQPGNQVARFWSRRQSHELTMHRADIDLALGAEPRIDAELAADGIAEVLDVFVHRRDRWDVPRLGAEVPVLLACTDRDDRWLIVPNGSPTPPEYDASGPVLAAEEAASAAATLRGTAADLLLLLWRRYDLESGRVDVDGDIEVVRRMLASRLTP